MSWLFEEGDHSGWVNSPFTWGACTLVITGTLDLLKKLGFNVSQFENDWTRFYQGFSVGHDNFRTKVVIKVGDVSDKRYDIRVLLIRPGEQPLDWRRFRVTDGPDTQVTAQYLSEKVAQLIRGDL